MWLSVFYPFGHQHLTLAPFHSILIVSLFRENLSSINPNLDTDLTVLCICFSKTVVDISTQCMEGNLAFTVPFGARHFRSSQAAAHSNPDTLCAHTHCAGNRLFHCSPETHTALQLGGNTFSNQLGIQ